MTLCLVPTLSLDNLLHSAGNFAGVYAPPHLPGDGVLARLQEGERLPREEDGVVLYLCSVERCLASS